MGLDQESSKSEQKFRVSKADLNCKEGLCNRSLNLGVYNDRNGYI